MLLQEPSLSLDVYRLPGLMWQGRLDHQHEAVLRRQEEAGLLNQLQRQQRGETAGHHATQSHRHRVHLVRELRWTVEADGRPVVWSITVGR